MDGWLRLPSKARGRKLDRRSKLTKRMDAFCRPNGAERSSFATAVGFRLSCFASGRRLGTASWAAALAVRSFLAAALITASRAQPAWPCDGSPGRNGSLDQATFSKRTVSGGVGPPWLRTTQNSAVQPVSLVRGGGCKKPSSRAGRPIPRSAVGDDQAEACLTLCPNAFRRSLIPVWKCLLQFHKHENLVTAEKPRWPGDSAVSLARKTKR